MIQKQMNVIFLLALGMLFFLTACQKQSEPKFAGTKIRDYANALYNRQLYQQAVEEYNYYLDNYNVEGSEAANVNYIIGDIYFERIRDYENALTYYMKIKHMYPESTLMEEVNKKIVACLERLQRSTDAQQALEETALLDPTQAKESRPGAVVAKIGKREITTGDLEYEINQLPPYMKSQVADKKDKVEFLKQYIATELLFDTARRKGLDKDKEVIAATFQAKKNFMVQKLLEEEVSQDVDIEESDIELYYKAHDEKYAKKDESGNIVEMRPLSEVRAQVMQDLVREKQKEAYERLVQRMMRAEAVEIYEDRL